VKALVIGDALEAGQEPAASPRCPTWQTEVAEHSHWHSGGFGGVGAVCDVRRSIDLGDGPRRFAVDFRVPPQASHRGGPP
jgi:hypothetical protein